MGELELVTALSVIFYLFFGGFEPGEGFFFTSQESIAVFSWLNVCFGFLGGGFTAASVGAWAAGGGCFSHWANACCSCGSLGFSFLGGCLGCDGGGGGGVVAVLPSQVAMLSLSGWSEGMAFCSAFHAMRDPLTAANHRCLSSRGCFLRRRLPLKSSLSLLRIWRLPFLNFLAVAKSTSASTILMWKLSLVWCSIEFR